ncbi:MAG TPA: RNA polymerase sigma factor [Syntrophales bacterium]|nr:RNA polymerase sigma factor [Syntrophales bacterium]HPX10661.1 RNA polymerase sigma factor [Syntrophales bacterium]HQB30497.1 RNA polymerase sigma factor [Syntrophales bacterium]HQN78339.1 RNA polymerase sigma factor [Syntrophales bacterium]HQQ27156.1 RNA polymerase sigma factor [Syntrophales bacterium]
MSKIRDKEKTRIEDLVEKAKAGDRRVLEEIVRRIQDRIYGLAIRMLFIPADAEDATQEILMKVITHLGTFKGKSRFETWVHRIAANHLLTTRKGRAESWRLTFDKCNRMIEEGNREEGGSGAIEAEQHLVVEETKRACVHYLLLCLKREIRLAYILGEIFGVGSAEGAEILGLTPAAYRQRLSRGRKRLTGFLAGKCGLVDPGNPCRCGTLAAIHVRKRHIDPKNLLFATHAVRSRQDGRGEDLVKELDAMARAAALLRSHPDYAAPGVFVESVKGLIDSGRFQLLTNS